MKKTIVIGVVSALFSSLTFAATGAACPDAPATLTAVEVTTAGTEACVCGGDVAAKTNYQGGSGAVVAAPIFVKNGFIIQCSSNTYVSVNEVSATGFAVAAGSRKGNQTVIGSSNGGAVTTDQACAATGCTAANITSANGRAATAAGGSGS